MFDNGIGATDTVSHILYVTAGPVRITIRCSPISRSASQAIFSGLQSAGLSMFCEHRMLRTQHGVNGTVRICHTSLFSGERNDVRLHCSG